MRTQNLWLPNGRMMIEIKQLSGTRIICAILLMICAFLFYQTFTFPKELGPAASEYGSAFFPRVLLGFIAVVSIFLIVQSFTAKRILSEDEVVSLKGTQLGRCVGLWLLCLGFYFAWRFLGYMIAAPLFLLAVGCLLATRNILTFVLLACLGPLMYLVFEKLLKVSL